MTRKIFVFLLAAMLIFSLLSCGNQISQKETIGEQNTPLVPAPPETQITQTLPPENQSSETPPPNTTPSQPSEDKQKIPNTAFYTTEDPLAFQSRYFEGRSISNVLENRIPRVCARILRSADEIESLDNKDQFVMYDETYFENNNLLVFEMQISGGVERITVVNAYIEIRNDVPIHVFNMLMVNYGETEMFHKETVMIEVDKSVDLQPRNFGFRTYQMIYNGISGKQTLRFPNIVIVKNQ